MTVLLVLLVLLLAGSLWNLTRYRPQEPHHETERNPE